MNNTATAANPTSIKTAEGEATRERPVLVPPVDIYERGDALVIEADMPGVGPQDVDVTLDNGTLTLKGRVATPAPSANVLYAEYAPSDFERSFSVSEEIDHEGIQASVRNGVLTVILPKAKERQPRKITVQAA